MEHIINFRYQLRQVKTKEMSKMKRKKNKSFRAGSFLIELSIKGLKVE